MTKYPENQRTWPRPTSGLMRYDGGTISAIFLAGETTLGSKLSYGNYKKPLKSPKNNFFSGIIG